MAQGAVSCNIKIKEYASCSGCSKGKLLNSKTLKIFNLKLFKKFFAGSILNKGPLIHRSDISISSESLLKSFFIPFLQQYLLWGKACKQKLYIIKGALSYPE